jgi:carbon-monoxide dehydrogenase medium subunit
VRPAAFDYHRPATLDAAVAMLVDAGPRARVIAGGQSLLPGMYRRQVRPSALVDLARVPGLRDRSHDGATMRLGALTTHADVEHAHLAGGGFGVLAEAAGLVGHAPIRNRGTVGGSLAHADPAAQWCTLAVLLDAEIVLHGPGGRRTVAAANFFVGAHRTAVAPGEILVEVRFGAAPSAALCQFAIQRRDLPVLVAGAALDVGPEGTVTAARLALGGVADRPLRCTAAERYLTGRVPGAAAIIAAARAATEDLDPPADGRGDAADRRELAATMLERAIRTSLARHPATADPTGGPR